MIKLALNLPLKSFLDKILKRNSHFKAAADVRDDVHWVENDPGQPAEGEGGHDGDHVLRGGDESRQLALLPLKDQQCCILQGIPLWILAASSNKSV